MHHRSLPLIAACAFAVAGCRTDLKDTTPYQSGIGLSFEIEDGTGIFYSKTKTYLPVYCGTEYPIRSMDIGQDNFDAIAGLVAAGDLWNAKVLDVPQCHAIDVALPRKHYRFDVPGRSVSIDVGQCQRIDPTYAPYLKAMRQIVRTVSDRQKLKVKGECVRF
jgi:hypothetical protein